MIVLGIVNIAKTSNKGANLRNSMHKSKFMEVEIKRMRFEIMFLKFKPRNFELIAKFIY